MPRKSYLDRPVKAGDVVTLSSEPSVKMTVEKVVDLGLRTQVDCVWFVGTSLHKSSFLDTVLRVVRS